MRSLIWDKKFFACLFFIYFLGRNCCDDVFEVSRAELSIKEKPEWHLFMYPGSLTGLVSPTFKIHILTIV